MSGASINLNLQIGCDVRRWLPLDFPQWEYQSGLLKDICVIGPHLYEENRKPSSDY
jgi:hypothetical protein